MKETITKVVKLARLKLPKEEWERFSEKAEHVVEYIEQLKKLDTTHVEPTSHAVEVTNAFREDVVKKFAGIAKILEIAPAKDKEGQLFEVPPVIE